MIGNDIVDLHLVSLQSNWRRKGWVQKVFTTSEQDQIYHTENPDQLVWQFWSMKEAAYKAHQRRFLHPPRYNPRDFMCSGDSVTIGKNRYTTCSEFTRNYIYTIAYHDRLAYTSKVFMKATVDYKNELQKYISSVLDMDVSKIFLDKDRNRIPIIKIEDTPTTIPFSFTNHGNYVAFVISF